MPDLPRQVPSQKSNRLLKRAPSNHFSGCTTHKPGTPFMKLQVLPDNQPRCHNSAMVSQLHDNTFFGLMSWSNAACHTQRTGQQIIGVAHCLSQRRPRRLPLLLSCREAQARPLGTFFMDFAQGQMAASSKSNCMRRTFCWAEPAWPVIGFWLGLGAGRYRYGQPNPVARLLAEAPSSSKWHSKWGRAIPLTLFGVKSASGLSVQLPDEGLGVGNHILVHVNGIICSSPACAAGTA
jgi:hypothetical protein